MAWFDSYRTPLINVFDLFYLRFRQFSLWLLGLISIVSLHLDLLHLSKTWTDRVSLVILVLMALNHSIVEKKE